VTEEKRGRMEFRNTYEDRRRAESYAKLEFPGTYYLAYRDLPEIIRTHARAGRAVDFGCGTGRSTRFLSRLGFDVIGLDISRDMVDQAKSMDPQGRYLVVSDNDTEWLRGEKFDLVLAAFTFDNIPSVEHKVRLFSALAGKLTSDGRIVNLVSSPDIYTHEWASFTTKDFPENRTARSGDMVKIVMTDVQDARPVVDIMWSDEDYRIVYRKAGLALLAEHRPLARDDEPFEWVNETRIPPWTIYVLGKGR
jgi:trans-aconitate methyltransferase